MKNNTLQYVEEIVDKRKSKSGRYKLPIEEKKNVCQKLYFTSEFNAYLTEKYELFDLSSKARAEKLREILATSKALVVYPLAQKQMYELNNLGSNLNQLIRIAHQNNNLLIAEQAEEVEQLLKKFKNQLLPKGDLK